MRVTSLLKPALLASTVLVGLSASALPVVNGSFEDIGSLGAPSNNGNLSGALDSPGEWAVYSSIPGWTSIAGAGIELHYAPVVANTPNAADGNIYVELDSHPEPGDGAMAQALSLAAGTYRLTFSYKPRTDVVGDNVISAYFDSNSDTIFPAPLITVDGPAGADWTQYTADFNWSGSGYLIFAASSDAGTVGGFIDNVSVTAVPDQGSTLLALGSVLMGLGVVSRRLRR